MALPLEFHETFEAGTKGNFDSETDTGKRLDFPHARDLAPLRPYRGAYCCRVNLGKNSDDAYLEEGISWASGQIRWGRFRLYVGGDVQFGNDLDHVTILQFYSSTSTKESRLLLARIDPVGIVLVPEGEGDTWGVDNVYAAIPTQKWVAIEWRKFVSSTVGEIDLFIPEVCKVASDEFPDGTITKYRLGAMDQFGDIQGTLLLDDFSVDEDRLYDDHSAHNGALSNSSLFLLQSGFAFLGSGTVEHVSLVDGGSGNCRVKLYDTDNPNALPVGSLRESLATTTASSTEQGRGRGFQCNRGCYVQLSGTNPQALIRLGHVASDHA